MNKKNNMESLHSLPDDYEPFNTLNFCSNTIIQGYIPIKAGNNVPLLIGKGVIPVVWLYVPIRSDRKKWRYIVERNVSHNEMVIVRISKELKSVDVSIELEGQLQELIRVKKISDVEAVVEKLDLSPIGFKISGDSNGLRIGEQLFVGNTFEGVYTMIEIGE